MAGVNVEVKIDESKVLIIRGPASLRDLAIKFIEEYERPDGPKLQYDHDRDQVIKWLKEMEI